MTGGAESERFGVRVVWEEEEEKKEEEKKEEKKEE